MVAARSCEGKGGLLRTSEETGGGLLRVQSATSRSCLVVRGSAKHSGWYQAPHCCPSVTTLLFQWVLESLLWDLIPDAQDRKQVCVLLSSLCQRCECPVPTATLAGLSMRLWQGEARLAHGPQSGNGPTYWVAGFTDMADLILQPQTQAGQRSCSEAATKDPKELRRPA